MTLAFEHTRRFLLDKMLNFFGYFLRIFRQQFRIFRQQLMSTLFNRTMCDIWLTELR